MTTSQVEARVSRNSEGHRQPRLQAFKSDKLGASQAIILVASHNKGTLHSHGRGNTGHSSYVAPNSHYAQAGIEVARFSSHVS